MANGNNEQQINSSSSSSNATNATEHSGDEPSSVLGVDLRLSSSGDVTGGCARGTLNDLVADLCLSGSNRSSNIGYGDFTNIRATPDRCGATLPSGGSVTSTQPSAPSATAASGSSFSFKHFLNSSGTVTAPSTTVTSLDAVTTTSATTSTTTITVSSANATPAPTNTAGTSASTSLATSANPLQSSTGARPKVPQSASASLMPSSDASLGGGSSTSKMKRSPRFSSFDSQASLAEYAAGGAGACRSDLITSGACRLTVDEDNDDDDVAADVRRGLDFFPSRLTGASSTPSASSSRYVPRSYSSYDMPPPAASPRRRSGISAGNRESRPNRLAFSTNQNANKMKLDLPLDSAAAGAGAAACSSNTTNRTLPTHQPSGGLDFIAAGHPAAAAALPDFVQDHWLDSWYAHDMHLNSPPNSPICEFGDDDLNAGGAAGGASVGDNSTSVGGLPGIDVFGAAIGNLNIIGGAGVGGGSVIGIGGSLLGVGPGGDGSNVGNPTAAKMLPDFLSDGPIIHSSQRLADVAVGLPSNSIGSPQDACTSLQLSTLRLEHERLQRELSEARAELSAQTRRANELERQLQQQQQEAARRRDSTVATQRLQKQVTLLKAEVAALHRENESLRESGGAVGGLTTTTSTPVGVGVSVGVTAATATANCDRPAACGGSSAATTSTSAAAAAAAANNASSNASNLSRPSRAQQYSRDLLLAAANAENNLRQLLAGVDNLRQIAAGLDSSTLTIDFDASPDLYSDFIEDDEEFEDYNGASGGVGGGVNN